MNLLLLLREFFFYSLLQAVNVLSVLLYSIYTPFKYKSIINLSLDRINSAKERQRALIVANGPSVNQFSLNQLLSFHADIYTMNFAYKHEYFKMLKPKLHFIIDKKLLNGTWSLTMVDRVLEISPTTIVVLDIRWYSSPKFKKYHNSPNVAWILPILYPSPRSNLSSLFGLHALSLNVFLAALSIVHKLKYSQVLFVGVDGDGLFKEICNQDSHSYTSRTRDASFASFNLLRMSLFMHVHFVSCLDGIIRRTNSSNSNTCSLHGGKYLCSLTKNPLVSTIPCYYESHSS